MFLIHPRCFGLFSCLASCWTLTHLKGLAWKTSGVDFALFSRDERYTQLSWKTLTIKLQVSDLTVSQLGPGYASESDHSIIRPFKKKHVTMWKRMKNAGPWKVTKTQWESNLPTTVFQGRTVKLQGCNCFKNWRSSSGFCSHRFFPAKTPRASYG